MSDLIRDPVAVIVGTVKLLAHGRHLRRCDRLAYSRLLSPENARVLLALGNHNTKGSKQ